jgi:hypothetical protein
MKVLQISDNGIGIDLVRNADKIFLVCIKHLQTIPTQRNWIIY